MVSLHNVFLTKGKGHWLSGLFVGCLLINCSVGSVSYEKEGLIDTDGSNSEDLIDDPSLIDSKWQLTYEDNFDSLDLEKYETRYIWPREEIINSEEQYYIDPTKHDFSPFLIENGHLIISASKTPESLKSVTSQPYLSGVLTSKNTFSQGYGRFEINAKLPQGKGLWPAFWLLQSHDTWPKNMALLPELDIMEAIGEDNVYHGTRHSNQDGSSKSDGSANDTGVDLATGFHKYSVEWDVKSIKWLFDDKLMYETATPSDFHLPKHFLLNLAVGGSWPGSPTSETPFPARFEIDYVRVYKQKDVP